METKAWIELNPLRAHRRKVGVDINTMSVAVGVSSQTVMNWERGSCNPSDDAMKKLVGITRNNDLPVMWDKWQSKRPKKIAAFNQ